MTDADNIRDVEVLGVDMIGFIFYPKSPRYLYQIPRYLPTLAKRVGVFVNETKENILMYVDRFGLNYVQLHGDESPEYCRTLAFIWYPDHQSVFHRLAQGSSCRI